MVVIQVARKQLAVLIIFIDKFSDFIHNIRKYINNKFTRMCSYEIVLRHKRTSFVMHVALLFNFEFM